MREWEQAELEEKLGQGVKLAQMLIENPDDCSIWDKLKAWSTEHKSYVSESYELREEMGYDISKLDGDESNLNF